MSNLSFDWCGFNLSRVALRTVNDGKISLSVTRSFTDRAEELIEKKQNYTIVFADNVIIVGSDKYEGIWIKAFKANYSDQISFCAPRMDCMVESIVSNDFAAICEKFYWFDPYIIGYILNVFTGK